MSPPDPDDHETSDSACPLEPERLKPLMPLADQFAYLAKLKPERVILLYEAGRLLNHLRFNLICYWFSYNDQDVAKDVERAVDELVRRVRFLRSELADRDTLDKHIQGAINTFLERGLDPETGDPVREFLDEYIDPQAFSPDEILDSVAARRSHCIVFSRVVLDAIESLHQDISVSLSDQERLVFRIGQAVDRGLRPGGSSRVWSEGGSITPEDLLGPVDAFGNTYW